MRRSLHFITTLVLSSGRRVRVRASAKQIRDRLRSPGYIKIGQAKLHREEVALICIDPDAVEEVKRRLLERRYQRR